MNKRVESDLYGDYNVISRTVKNMWTYRAINGHGEK